MKKMLPIISYAALGLIVIPPILFFTGTIEDGLLKTLMLVGTVVWFATAPLWIKGTEGSAEVTT